MAKTFVITAPNGKKYKVTGEGTREDALQHLQQQLGGGEPSPPSPSLEAPALAPTETGPSPEVAEAEQYMRGRGKELQRQEDVAQYEALPGWKKPIVAASDILQTGARFPASMLTRAASYIPLGFGIDPAFRDPQTGQMPATPAKMITPEDVIARLRTGKTEGPEFEAEVAKQKRQTEAAANRAGLAGTGAEILATAGLPIAKVFGAGRPLLNLAATSAGYGALSEDDPLKGAASGLAGGTLGYYGGKVISKAAETGLGLLGKALPVGSLKVPAKVMPMTADEFKLAASDAFDEAESHGVVFNQQGLLNIKNKVEPFLKTKGYRAGLQPKIAEVLKAIDEYVATGTATQREIQTLREVASGAFDTGNRKNNMFVGKIIREIDRLGTNLDHMSAAPGSDPLVAQAAARRGRDMYSKGAQLETVQNAIQRGEDIGETNLSKNVPQAVRKQLISLINPRKPGAGRGFTEAGKQAIRATTKAKGREAAALEVAKLAGPVTGIEMLGHLYAAGQTGGASLLYSVPATVARLGIGAAANRYATHMAQKSVDELIHVISTGQTSRQAAQSILQKLTASKRQAVMQGLGRLGMGAGVVAAQPLNEAYLKNEQ